MKCILLVLIHLTQISTRNKIFYRANILTTDCILIMYDVKCLVSHPVAAKAVWWNNEMHK
jgi:hypothetical protein